MQKCLHCCDLDYAGIQNYKQNKTNKSLTIVTRQNILLKSFLQYDCLGLSLVLQTEIKCFTLLIIFHD